MRTDVQTDRKQVRCPNASLLGFGQYVAKFGDFVTFNEGGEPRQSRFGRVAGRITVTGHASTDRGTVYILVIAMDADHTHAYERWVLPGDIETIRRPADFQADSLLFLLDADFTKHSIETMRNTFSEGWSTPGKWLAWKQQQAERQAEFDARHANCDVTACDFCGKFKLRAAAV